MWHQITRQQKVLALTARVELTLSRFYAGKKTQRNSLAAAAAFLNPAPKKLGQLDTKSLHFFRDASTNSNLSLFFFAFHFEPGIEKLDKSSDFRKRCRTVSTQEFPAIISIGRQLLECQQTACLGFPPIRFPRDVKFCSSQISSRSGKLLRIFDRENFPPEGNQMIWGEASPRSEIPPPPIFSLKVLNV